MLNKKIILVILIGAVLSLLISDFLIERNIIEEMKELFIYKTYTHKKYDIAVVGDSRVYRGITADPFREILNVSIINLGYSSGSISKKALDLAEQKLDQSGKKIMLIGITAHALTEDAARDKHIESIEKLKKEEVLEYLYFAPVKRLFKSCTPQKLYSIIFKNKNEGNYIQDPHINSGWVASDYKNRMPNSSIPSYIDRLQKTKLSKKLIDDLFTKTQEWTKKGYKVIYFYPPSSYNNEHAEDLILNFNRQDFYKLSLKYGAKWISLDSSYTSYDGSHLIKESAIVLSNEIALKIKNQDFVKGNSIINENVYFNQNSSVMSKPYSIASHSIVQPFIKDSIFKISKSDTYIGTYKFDSLSNVKEIKVFFEVYSPKFEEAYLACNIYAQNDTLFNQIKIHKMTINNNWNSLLFDIDLKNTNDVNDIDLYFVNKNNHDMLIRNLEFFSYKKQNL